MRYTRSIVPLLNNVLQAIEDLQAVDIRIYDMQQLSPFYEYSVICSGRSDRQTRAIYERLVDLAQQESYAYRVEGAEGGRWILVDLGRVIINIFVPEEREYFNLEKLWLGVPQITIDDVRNL
jgi:ribosome-associated protein